jgi:beta-glucosidase
LDASAFPEQSPDFLGINYYATGRVRKAHAFGGFEALPPTGDEPSTAMGWHINPQGLVRALEWVRERYGEIPLYITENGAAFEDPPVQAGEIHDQARQDYFKAHLIELQGLLAKGLDLRGYFAWSLLDNFEWHHGYGKRFGLVALDSSDGHRMPKKSAAFYREVIQTRGDVL